MNTSQSSLVVAHANSSDGDASVQEERFLLLQAATLPELLQRMNTESPAFGRVIYFSPSECIAIFDRALPVVLTLEDVYGYVMDQQKSQIPASLSLSA